MLKSVIKSKLKWSIKIKKKVIFGFKSIGFKLCYYINCRGQLFKARLYNPGLKFAYKSVSFETLKMKTPIDPDKMSEQIFLKSQTSCWKNLI